MGKMTKRVYRLDSGFELRLDEVHSYFDGYETPEGVEDVTLERRGNKLIVAAEGTEDSTPKYTPTAQLKADVTERRMYETEDGWSRETPEQNPRGATQELQEDPETKLVEFACFKGDRETVLQNTDLQYEMFEVLCDLALHAGQGELTAVVAIDGKLSAARIVDGERRKACIEIVDESEGCPDNTSNWRDNSLISD
jgi:hypothetical protein